MGKGIGGFFKFFVLPVLLVAVVVFGIKVYKEKVGAGGTESAYQFILDHFNSRGELIDFKSEIRVTSSKDIKFFLTEKKATIEFGIIRMEWKPKEMVSQEWQKKLERIGITMKKEKDTNRLLLFYGEDEIERWVQ